MDIFKELNSNPSHPLWDKIREGMREKKPAARWIDGESLTATEIVTGASGMYREEYESNSDCRQVRINLMAGKLVDWVYESYVEAGRPTEQALQEFMCRLIAIKMLDAAAFQFDINWSKG